MTARHMWFTRCADTVLQERLSLKPNQKSYYLGPTVGYLIANNKAWALVLHYPTVGADLRERALAPPPTHDHVYD